MKFIKRFWPLLWNQKISLESQNLLNRKIFLLVALVQMYQNVTINASPSELQMKSLFLPHNKEIK